jgi:hypothetical protein
MMTKIFGFVFVLEIAVLLPLADWANADWVVMPEDKEDNDGDKDINGIVMRLSVRSQEQAIGNNKVKWF